jgi:hypothetical protein
MAENETLNEKRELTSEQKKVLGKVYRYILSLDKQPSEHSAVPSIEIQDREQLDEIAPIVPISKVSTSH